jgi:hypothetical protein
MSTPNPVSTTQNALVGIAYGDLTAAAGSVVDHVLVTATASNPANSPASQSVAPGTATVTFASLNPDTYTITAQAFPASGAGFGTPVSTTIAITAVATVTLSVPTSLSATQP